MLYSDTLQRFCFECRSSLKRLRREEGGATAITTAIILTVLVGFVGLGTEVGLWYAERRSMQTASDAAAVGGAYEIYEEGKNAADDAVAAAAQADSKRNGFEHSVNGVTVEVNRPPTSGEFAGEDTAVETIVTKQRATLLGSFFMGDNVNIKVRSVATVEVTGVFCILALAEHQDAALFFGGNAEVRLVGCGINVNSDAPEGAMTAQGASVVGATYADIVGGLKQSNNAELEIPPEDVTTGADPIADPYAHLDVPSSSGCNHGTPPVFKVGKNDNVTLSPGTYCGGLEIAGIAKMTAGNYIIAGGQFKVSGTLTTDTVDGVTIFLTDYNGDDNYATVDIVSQATVNITAATSGDYMGIAFFQDRGAPSSTNSGSTNKLTGGSTMSIVGAVYFPKQNLQFNGGNATTGTCTRVVAFKIDFIGNSGLNTNCGYGFGTPQIYPPVLAE
jgi:Flp pilus assembly protein TadG